MEIIERIISGISLQPLCNILDLMSLAPDVLWAPPCSPASCCSMTCCTALMTEHTRSVAVHALVCTLTLYLCDSRAGAALCRLSRSRARLDQFRLGPGPVYPVVCGER